MKPKSLLLSSCAVFGAVSLSSCVVDPYAGGAVHGSVTYTDHRPGYMVDTLPSRYETETYDGVRYYRYNDVYYRPQGRRYVVVETPRRARTTYRRHGDHVDVIRRLPGGYKKVTHRGAVYYRADGRWYRPSRGGYVIVSSPY
ncbi:MAG: DUF6515 family protein [Verrucomicrobiota bacterium]